MKHIVTYYKKYFFIIFWYKLFPLHHVQLLFPSLKLFPQNRNVQLRKYTKTFFKVQFDESKKIIIKSKMKVAFLLRTYNYQKFWILKEKLENKRKTWRFMWKLKNSLKKDLRKNYTREVFVWEINFKHDNNRELV